MLGHSARRHDIQQILERVIVGALFVYVVCAVISISAMQTASLNLSHFVAHQIWRRRGMFPLRCRAHRLQRRGPLCDFSCDTAEIFSHILAVPLRLSLW
jgi:hypothetical protein